MGPALLPQSLERLRPTEATAVISNGRAATQMAGFSKVLKADEIAQLVQWIYSPVRPVPSWTEADIRDSRIDTPGAAAQVGGDHAVARRRAGDRAGQGPGAAAHQRGDLVGGV